MKIRAFTAKLKSDVVRLLKEGSLYYPFDLDGIVADYGSKEIAAKNITERAGHLRDRYIPSIIGDDYEEMVEFEY